MKYPLYLFVLSLIMLSSCKTVPYTDRSQFIITSRESEIQLGEQEWVDTLKKSKISHKKLYNSALQRVGKNIANIINEKDYKWEFMVLVSDTPNAFCLPGGKVAVYSGLFKILDNDAELAAVVGHEIAHAIARHAAERLSQQYLEEFGGLGASIALSVLSIPTFGMEGQVLGIVTDFGIMLPYSRTQEYEADQIGLILMAKAGYNPNAAVTFWKKYSENSDDNIILEFFATHPMDKKRLKEIEKFLPKALKYYKKNPIKRNLGMKYPK